MFTRLDHDCSSLKYCSGNGYCDGPSNCTCQGGMIGNDCSLYNCFNKTGSSVCLGRGACIGTNNCACKPGYIGSQCETPSCFGVYSTNSTVCSGAGLCVDYNLCVCRNGYSDLNCSNFYCNGISRYNQSVCNGNGICTAPNVCSCKVGTASNYCYVTPTTLAPTTTTVTPTTTSNVVSKVTPTPTQSLYKRLRSISTNLCVQSYLPVGLVNCSTPGIGIYYESTNKMINQDGQCLTFINDAFDLRTCCTSTNACNGPLYTPMQQYTTSTSQTCSGCFSIMNTFNGRRFDAVGSNLLCDLSWESTYVFLSFPNS
jgi:hypothetical protein